MVQECLRVVLHQANAQSEADEAGDVVNVEPVHELGAMCFDGLDADVQDAGNFLRRFSLGNELQRFTLARREQFQRTSFAPDAAHVAVSVLASEAKPGRQVPSNDIAVEDFDLSPFAS